MIAVEPLPPYASVSSLATAGEAAALSQMEPSVGVCGGVLRLVQASTSAALARTLAFAAPAAWRLFQLAPDRCESRAALGLLVALERRCERAERPGDRSHHQRAADGEPTGARNQELV